MVYVNTTMGISEVAKSLIKSLLEATFRLRLQKDDHLWYFLLTCLLRTCQSLANEQAV